MASRSVRLLLVAAHPADTFDQCGGTLAHHVQEGDSVTVVTATSGTRSHDWELIDDLRRSGGVTDVEQHQREAGEKKLEEMRKACAILGITDLRTLPYHDDQELLQEEMVQHIADIIREIRPDILITHHPYEDGGFKLHASVGRATMFAFRKAAGSGRGRSAPGHEVPAVFFMNPTAYVGVSIDSSFIGKIDLYVDITDVIDRKVRAMDCIGSQYYGGSFARKRAEAADGHYGYDATVGYAESFQRYRPQVYYTLPVSDFEILRSTSLKQYMDNVSTLIAADVPLPEGEVKARSIVDKALYNA